MGAIPPPLPMKIMSENIKTIDDFRVELDVLETRALGIPDGRFDDDERDENCARRSVLEELIEAVEDFAENHGCEEAEILPSSDMGDLERASTWWRHRQEIRKSRASFTEEEFSDEECAARFGALERVEDAYNVAISKEASVDPMDGVLLAIAKEHLYLETLETRSSDSLDFSDQSVWGIRAALEAAFKAGSKS